MGGGVRDSDQDDDDKGKDPERPVCKKWIVLVTLARLGKYYSADTYRVAVGPDHFLRKVQKSSTTHVAW